MGRSDLELTAHLLRRAGFGATRDELERCVANGYEATVEELLDPPDRDAMPDDVIRRYHVDQSELRLINAGAASWLYRMVTTQAPLEEKMALFWHSLFATGEAKVNNGKTMAAQIERFRRHGLGKFDEMLVQLSKDPAMLFWLDNNENHNGAINENYGRELLELFAMGIGNYTEEDIKEASRAFTGWTVESVEYMGLRSNKASIWPYGRVSFQFEYRPEDHDDGDKTFLGETGPFNGEDVIQIIARQRATAEFICRRLHQFFVADEVDNNGRVLIDQMVETYFESGYEIRSVLRTLFNADFFKNERRVKVKSPVELVVGTVRLAQDFQWPRLEMVDVARSTGFMGQALLNPPTVEGWHEGLEWIDSGALVERINFAGRFLGDTTKPGVRAIIERLASMDGGVLSPEELVDGCLDLIGPIELDESTKESLIQALSNKGDIDLSSRDDDAEQRIADTLRLISSTREYQMA